MARVFVGIPTLNRPRYVREAIRSVLAQSFQDFRLVVSDNDSEPEAVESVSRFVSLSLDPRVTFCRQSRDVGEYGQGRFFFREAKDEEFFVILHDDDVLEPAYLERAVELLSLDPSLAYFVANPYLMDAHGAISRAKTLRYLSRCGRKGRTEGEIDVLGTHLGCGLTPISGACFRTQALRDSGFVDSDCGGNFPFESNIFLRLGERGARAWFCPAELLGFRFHDESLINYLCIMENRQVVDTMRRLFERRRFSGANERRRRAIVGRLCRASAMIHLKSGDNSTCRRDIVRALRLNPRSVRSWLLSPLALAAPGLLRAILPPLPEARTRPRYVREPIADEQPAAAGDS